MVITDQRQIEIVTRDRGGGYALAAAAALPHATQVADRWHLMENASRAFLDAVQKSMRQIRRAIGAATINPDLLTAVERIQYEFRIRDDVGAAVNHLRISLTTRRSPMRCSTKRISQSWLTVSKNAWISASRTQLIRRFPIPNASASSA
jgi:transposase